MIDGLNLGNDLDFDKSTLGKGLDGYGRAGRIGGCEILAIHLVEDSKVGHIGHEDRDLDHLVHRRTGSLDDGLDVLEALNGLAAEVGACEVAGSGVDAQLTAGKKHAVHFDGLTVGTDGSRCILSADDFFHIISLMLCFVEFAAKIGVICHISKFSVEIFRFA